MKKGFTLIELLVVIGILGVLAVVVFVALDPIQQQARTRDAGRRNAVTQLGRALAAYGASSASGAFVTEAAGTWIDALVTSGDIGAAPSTIAYTAGTQIQPNATVGCTPAASQVIQSGYCYDATGTGTAPAIIFTRLESKTEDAKCTTAADGAWVVYNTASGRAGTVCLGAAASPTVGTPGTFVD